jgi:hypothetical protein
MTIAEQIHQLLDPLIGEIMTKSTLSVNCGKIGKTPESLYPEDMQALSYHLSKGLIFFIGTEKAKQIADSIAKMS